MAARSIRRVAVGPGHKSLPHRNSAGSCGRRIPHPPAQVPKIHNEREAAAEATDYVVVETDAAHRDYDARLAAWLTQTERARGFAERLPFPRRHRIDAADLERDYRMVQVAPDGDTEWQFSLRLPKSAVVERDQNGETAAPATLARVAFAGSTASIDFVGLRLTSHVDLASWLEEWLEQLGMTAVSSRPRTTRHGVMGDILATQRTRDGITVARYATVRDGERTFVLVLRTALANYRLVANDFILAVSSFRAGSSAT